jgi:hypothetical protein
MEFKGYVIPSVNVEDGPKNLVIRTEAMAHVAAGSSDSDGGYLIKGERKWVKGEGFLGRFFWRVNYFDKKEFYRDLVRTFSGEGEITDEQVESFARKRGLEAENLLFR